PPARGRHVLRARGLLPQRLAVRLRARRLRRLGGDGAAGRRGAGRPGRGDGAGALLRALRTPHRGRAPLLVAGDGRPPRLAPVAGLRRRHDLLLAVGARGPALAGVGAGGAAPEDARPGRAQGRGARGVAPEAPRGLDPRERVPAAAPRRHPRAAPPRPRRDALPDPLRLPPRGGARGARPRRGAGALRDRSAAARDARPAPDLAARAPGALLAARGGADRRAALHRVRPGGGRAAGPSAAPRGRAETRREPLVSWHRGRNSPREEGS